jgi:hypothetical protein
LAHAKSTKADDELKAAKLKKLEKAAKEAAEEDDADSEDEDEKQAKQSGSDSDDDDSVTAKVPGKIDKVRIESSGLSSKNLKFMGRDTDL